MPRLTQLVIDSRSPGGSAASLGSSSVGHKLASAFGSRSLPRPVDLVVRDPARQRVGDRTTVGLCIAEVVIEDRVGERDVNASFVREVHIPRSRQQRIVQIGRES